MATEAAAPTNGATPPAAATAAAGQLPVTPPVTPAVPAHAQPATAAAPAGDWTQGLSAEHRGWLQAKGVSAPGDLVDMWKGMESVVGAPRERIAVLPGEIKSLDDARPVLARLGTPATPAEYALKAGVGGNQAMTDQVAAIFHKAALTGHQAELVATEWNQLTTNIQTQQAAQYDARVVQEKQALAVEWGAAHDQNISIARSTAARFGVPQTVINALEKAASTETSAGYNQVMKFFHQIGVAMGESPYHAGAPGLGQMTPEQATAEKAMLMGDSAWKQSYLKGDAAKIKQMSRLILAEHGMTE